MWWCFGCYFCLPILFTVLCQLATRNVSSDSSSTQKQRNLDDRSSNQKRQQHQAVERQLNCTLLALAVMYGICALPEHVCNITLAYTHFTISEDTAAMLALLHHFLLFFKASVTPVLLLCLCKVSLRGEGLKCETVKNSITETQNDHRYVVVCCDSCSVTVGLFIAVELLKFFILNSDNPTTLTALLDHLPAV